MDGRVRERRSEKTNSQKNNNYSMTMNISEVLSNTLSPGIP
jgi:hypothetical protein